MKTRITTRNLVIHTLCSPFVSLFHTLRRQQVNFYYSCYYSPEEKDKKKLKQDPVKSGYHTNKLKVKNIKYFDMKI